MITVRKDNEADAVNVEMNLSRTNKVRSSFTTTTVRTDNSGDPVDVVQVIASTHKERV